MLFRAQYGNHTYNSDIWEVETKGWGILGQNQFIVSLESVWTIWNLIAKTDKKESWFSQVLCHRNRKITNTEDTYIQIYIYIYMYTYI